MVGIRNNIIKYNVIVELVSLQHYYLILIKYVFSLLDQFLTAFLQFVKLIFCLLCIMYYLYIGKNRVYGWDFFMVSWSNGYD